MTVTLMELAECPHRLTTRCWSPALMVPESFRIVGGLLAMAGASCPCVRYSAFAASVA